MIKQLLLILLTIIVFINIQYSEAVNRAGQECIFTGPVEQFEAITFYECSSTLPGWGKFDLGTTGWKIDTSGGGQLLSYPTTVSIYGEVGLRCAKGQTAIIEIANPISVTTVGGSGAFEWDQFGACVHYRANTTATNSNRLIAGKFYMELHDAYDTDIREVAMADFSSDAINNTVVNTLGTNTTFLNFSTGNSPYHPDWHHISKLRLVYTVPSSSYNIPITEILIERVILYAYSADRAP